MAEPLKLRVWGAFAPEGSPESDYFKTSIRYGTQSPEFRAASKRLDELGCPVFNYGQEPVWDGERWTIKEAEPKPRP